MLKKVIYYLKCFFSKKCITIIAGYLADKNIPLFTQISIRLFCKLYDINMSEFKKNRFSDYSTFNDFFTRSLKTHSRPIKTTNNQVSFPCDGTISQFGQIVNGRLFQAKNISYSLNSLLAEKSNFINMFYDGLFITIYLSPKDYHRVHMPYDGIIEKMMYIPGNLLSLKLSNSNKIHGVFTKNERLICIINTLYGKIAQILIGSTIVGSINVKWNGCVNKKHDKEIKYWTYPKKNEENCIFIKKGEEMGRFQLGSTVINLFEKNFIKLNKNLYKGLKIKLGEYLGDLINSKE